MEGQASCVDRLAVDVGPGARFFRVRSMSHSAIKSYRGAMNRIVVFLVSLSFACGAFAGFKVKLIKPKKAGEFQTRAISGDVTFAADLVLDRKTQNAYFYKELSPANVIAVRLGVFNAGGSEVVLPIDGLQLLDPSGRELAPVAPEAVAQALINGLVVKADARKSKPVEVAPQARDPRLDPTDPRYDPRLDPNDPRYDPRYDPTYNPNDPRMRRYPNGTYGGPWGRPGVDVVLSPGGGSGSGDLSQHEKALVEKDFVDKAHSLDPVEARSARDKFLFFSIEGTPAVGMGFVLKLPPAKGIPREIILRF